jgi:hypothetical protein
METCLRDLQDELKELRTLQLLGTKNKGPSSSKSTTTTTTTTMPTKKITPKSFMTIQRKLFHKLAQLRAVLLHKCTSERDQFLSKTGELHRLQQPCEKLLRGLLERLGSWASQGGFTLTPAVFHTVADILELVYTNGSTRTLLDSMAKWEELLNDKTTTVPTRIALFHCVEILFVSTVSKKLVSYLEPFVQCSARQFKLLLGHDVGSIHARAAAIRCVGRAMDVAGNSGVRHHAPFLKLIQRASQDRAVDVRRAASGALTSLARAAYEWGDFDHARGTVTVDQLLAVGAKAADDVDCNQEVQVAFGRTVGYVLSLAIAHGRDVAKEIGIGIGGGGGKCGSGGDGGKMGGGDGDGPDSGESSG